VAPAASPVAWQSSRKLRASHSFGRAAAVWRRRQRARPDVGMLWVTAPERRSAAMSRSLLVRARCRRSCAGSRGHRAVPSQSRVLSPRSKQTAQHSSHMSGVSFHVAVSTVQVRMRCPVASTRRSIRSLSCTSTSRARPAGERRAQCWGTASRSVTALRSPLWVRAVSVTAPNAGVYRSCSPTWAAVSLVCGRKAVRACIHCGEGFRSASARRL